MAHAMSASEYLLHYALPNFFSHTTTAYAFSRHVGVPVGKADFDGYHVYGADIGGKIGTRRTAQLCETR